MGTKYQGTPTEVRALNTFIKVTRGTQSMLSRLEPNITRHGLTGTQFGILETLYHLGPVNQRNLGDRMLMSKGNISVVVNNLAGRGLVERVRDTQDRRRTLVHLTAAGRKLIARIFPEQVAFITRELSTLSSREQEELGRLMKRLGRGADVD